MNDSYYIHRELNKKKVAIMIAIIISIIVVLVLSFGTFKNYNSLENSSSSTSIFYDNSNTVCVELSKSYELAQYDSENDYIIELRSDNNAGVFISKIEKIENKSLYNIIKADNQSFIQTFNSYSNLSEIKELSVNGNLAYIYSFHYLDPILNKPFYIQIIWLEMNDCYYVFDVEFPLDDLMIYPNLVTETLSSFKNIKSDT